MNLRVLLISLVFIYTNIQAQNPAQLLVNSGDALTEGIKLHEDGKYKDAIRLYNTISRSDTNYHRALYELSLSYYSDSNFLESKKWAETGLKLFPTEASDWFNLIANSLDELGKKENAINYYDSSLQRDPNKYVALFNKGVIYFNLKNYPEAKKLFQQCLMIYPYYASAHYFLGTISLEEGDLVNAILCFTTNLLVHPENKYSSNAIRGLNIISRVTDEVVNKVNARKETSNDPFDLLQEILLSKVALDEKYKLTTDVEDPITRQLQVVLEKLEPGGNDDQFFQQFYAPFYRKVFLEKKYNLMVNHIFRGLDIKSIKEFKKKNSKELEVFVSSIVQYFNLIRNSRTLAENNRSTAPVYYLYDNNVLIGKGGWKEDAGKILFNGPWEFYHNNGALKSKGSFNQLEKKEGEWFYYYQNGNLKEHSRYRNDTANGKSTFWFDNGILNEDRNFKDGLFSGEMKEYYYTGQLKTLSNYEKGLKQGLVRGFHSNGVIEYESMLVNDLQEGKTIFYHPNGKMESTADFIKGNAEGHVIQYNEDGSKEMEGSKLQNKRTGVWKTYYPSGKLHETDSYIKGEFDGEILEYHENGKIKDKSFYVKGLIDKKDESFDEDGVRINEFVYEKGKLKEAYFFNKEGKEFSHSSLRNGKAKIDFYSTSGVKTETSEFSANGVRDGKAVYYYPSGNISGYKEYSNGKMNGPYVSYYQNGQISDSSNYQDDTLNGYSISYNENGKIKAEGWWVDGLRQGLHIEYNYLGVAITEYYYLNDKLDGYMVSYSPNGRKEYEQLFVEGWPKQITQFDTTNNIVFENKFEKGSGAMTFLHNNRKPYIVNHYEQYYRSGKSEVFFFDSSISSQMYYKNGLLDSSYQEYFYGGNLRSEGKYLNGNKEGLWKFYYENKQLRYQETYVKGNDEGSIILFNDDGQKDKLISYKDGELDGSTIYYGEDGSVGLILKFIKGKLQSYSYENSEGKYIPDIILPNGTGFVSGFYRNGKKSVEIQFQEGLLNGSRKLFFTNGKPYVEGTFQWNLENGSKKVYYQSGDVQKEENYINDSKMNICKSYFPNGKLKTLENWYLGEMHGPTKIFEENGKLKETRIYYYGVLQSVNK